MIWEGRPATCRWNEVSMAGVRSSSSTPTSSRMASTGRRQPVPCIRAVTVLVAKGPSRCGACRAAPAATSGFSGCWSRSTRAGWRHTGGVEERGEHQVRWFVESVTEQPRRWAGRTGSAGELASIVAVGEVGASRRGHRDAVDIGNEQRCPCWFRLEEIERFTWPLRRHGLAPAEPTGLIAVDVASPFSRPGTG